MKDRPTTSPASNVLTVAVPFRHPIMQLWKVSYTASTISPNFSRRKGATTIWSNAHQSSAPKHSRHHHRPLQIPPKMYHISSEAWGRKFGSPLFYNLLVCHVPVLRIPGPINFVSSAVLDSITLVNHEYHVPFKEIVVQVLIYRTLFCWLLFEHVFICSVVLLLFFFGWGGGFFIKLVCGSNDHDSVEWTRFGLLAPKIITIFLFNILAAVMQNCAGN